MQLVIDIPDNLYDAIEKDEYGVHQGRIYDLIRNGIPLPKGHGRLIDTDNVKCERTDFDTYHDYCTMFDEVFDNAPTIIEADKEDK